MNFIKEMLFDAVRDEDFGGGELPKRVISTLQCGTILPLRHCGNTTRQVDWAVQKLFDGERIKVQDHYLGGQDKKANDGLLEGIMLRLNVEAKTNLMTENFSGKSRKGTPEHWKEIWLHRDFLDDIFDRQFKI